MTTVKQKIHIKMKSKQNTCQFTFIDLFCGIGGFHMAMKQLGGSCVYASEIDAKCRDIYQLNHSVMPHGDISQRGPIPPHDLLCAGFPCFIAGTPILTHNGYKSIETVTTDDQLMTHTGHFHKINNLQKKLYNGPLYTISLCNGLISITGTPEHPIYIRKDHLHSSEWISLQYLQNTDYCGMIINSDAIIPYVDRLPSPSEMYTLGSIVSKQSQLGLLINHNSKWYTILRQFERSIPEWVHHLPESYIYHFIMGLIQDGSINHKYIADVQRLCIKVGYIYNEADNSLNSLSDYQDQVLIDGNYVWFKISNINVINTTSEYVYNFEVESDNSYIANNIIVHNCQAFSNAGMKRAFNDSRGLLFDHIVSILQECKTPYALLENVKHIKKVSGGQVYQYIYDQLNSIGYQVFDVNILPKDLNVPQNRERILFIVIRNDLYTPDKKQQFLLQLEENKEICKRKNAGLVIFEDNPSPIYNIDNDQQMVLDAWDEFIKIFSKVGKIISPVITEYFTMDQSIHNQSWKNNYIKKNNQFYQTYRHLIDPWYSKYQHILTKRVVYGKLEWQTGGIRSDDSIYNHFIQIRQSGIRVKKTDCFPTLVAIVQTPIIGQFKRHLTPRECARLQSIPDTFSFGNQSDKYTYKQLGNGVNVDMITVVGQTLLNVFQITHHT